MNLTVFKNLLLAVTMLLCLTSCDPSKRLNRDFTYFQYERGDVMKVVLKELTIKTNDLLQIQILSQTTLQEQAAIFNSGVSASQGYLVTPEGMIELALIGKVKVTGLTKFELQDVIREKVTPFVKEPLVTVRFLPIAINMLGEVRSPGTKTFAKDKFTILDAIGAAGDLTDYGMRENVTVSREENGGARKLYEIDLRSTALFFSPVYQLQQNDIVYVNPNKQRLKALKDKGDFGRNLQIGLTLLSTATSLYFLFSK